MYVKGKPSRASLKLTPTTKSGTGVKAPGLGKSKSFGSSSSGKKAAMSCTSRLGLLIIAVFCSILAFQSIGKGNGMNLQERKLGSAARRMLNSTFGEGSNLKKEQLAELVKLRQWHQEWQKGAGKEAAGLDLEAEKIDLGMPRSANRDDMRRLTQETEPEAPKEDLKQLKLHMEEEANQRVAKEVEKYKELQAQLEAAKAELESERASSSGLRMQLKELQEGAVKGSAMDGSESDALLKQVEQLKREKMLLETEVAEGKSALTTGEDWKPLKNKLDDCQTAFSRLVNEKARLEMKLAKGEGWQKLDIEKEAMAIAKETLAQCGKQTGGMVVKANVPVWKGYACEATDEELKQYFDYQNRGMCPDDWIFVQDLIYVKNCFALPKRRCKNRTPRTLEDPTPFPRSLFDQGALKDASVRWDLHQCKSFECLNTRMVGDCRNCFNLTLESHRWRSNYRGGLKMADVIKMKNGTLRIGLDAGGGTGSFAAHMARFNVTVMTTAMNIETLWDKTGGLPYMETIALRGLVPLHVPHKARLPFFDNTLDVIHSVNSIKYLPILDFEELIFEWDRVLRPGGIIWFEMFYAPDAEIALYIASVDLLDYKKLYWNLTPKPDIGERSDVPHTYLNAVIEKPVRMD